MGRLFFALGLVGCAHTADPIAIAPGVPAPERELARTESHPVGEDTCILHGTGLGTDPIGIGASADAPPLVLLKGTYPEGVTWHAIGNENPHARIDVRLFGVRIDGFANVDVRRFRPLALPSALDGMATPVPGTWTTVESAKGADAIVHVEAKDVHPSLVRGLVSCADLTMSREAPVRPDTREQGAVVRPKGTWLQVRRSPGAPIARTVLASALSAYKLDETETWSRVRVRTSDAEIEGWVSTADIYSPHGYGHGTIGRGSGAAMVGCPSGRERRTSRMTEMHVGASPGFAFGSIAQGTVVIETRTSGAWSAISTSPCEIVPARPGEELWVRTSDLE